jgi:hypothetical protein
MSPADGVADRANLVVAELDNPITNRAMQVIVSRIPVVVFVDCAICQAKLAQQASLNQQAQRSINGRPADCVT